MKWSQMKSPLGVLTFVVSEKGLSYLSFSEEWRNHRWLQGQKLERGERAVLPYMKQIGEYLAGERKQFTLPLDVRYGTPFQQSVWKALQSIPYGEVWSYKDVAQSIDHPKAVRAVGGANNKNPLPILIPCHRVIGANGALVGYGGGLPIKKHLLALEGFPMV